LFLGQRRTEEVPTTPSGKSVSNGLQLFVRKEPKKQVSGHRGGEAGKFLLLGFDEKRCSRGEAPRHPSKERLTGPMPVMRGPEKKNIHRRKGHTEEKKIWEGIVFPIETGKGGL